MRILNTMFGRGLGGLEQAAYDYHEALTLADCDVTSILHKQAAMTEKYAEAGFDYLTLKPFAEWDICAAKALRKQAHAQQADAIIAHGNRAIGLALKACKGHIPVIGVAHNYNIKKRMPKCDAVLCITRDLIEEMVHLNFPRAQLFHIPNLIRMPPIIARDGFHLPITIGTLGRFVEKKGMDILLHAIAALREQKIDIRAIIGGDGELAPALQQQAQKLGIEDCTSFPGWVGNKQAFFESLDIFVLPSHHEPFGIVLIEAMAAGLPCITTSTEGPCEIITQYQDAVMIDKAKPYAMAQAIAELIETPDTALGIGLAARSTAQTRYDISVVSQLLHKALKQLI